MMKNQEVEVVCQPVESAVGAVLTNCLANTEKYHVGNNISEDE